MATLTGFTRGSDPIVSADLASHISTDISITVTVEIHLSDISVTGAITETNRTAIQSSINSYLYAALEYGVGLYADPDNTMAANSNTRVPTQKAVKSLMNTNSRKAWVTGVLKNGAFTYMSKAVTVSGVATFYLTDNGLSTGNAVFTNVYADTISVVVYGNAANFQPYSPVIAGDKKSITINVNQTTSVLLGVIQFVSASNGVDVRLLVAGDAN